MPPRKRHHLDDQVLGVYHAPPDPRFAPACTCGHRVDFHAFGRLDGRNVRKACNAAEPEPCPCRRYVPQERTEETADG